MAVKSPTVRRLLGRPTRSNRHAEGPPAPERTRTLHGSRTWRRGWHQAPRGLPMSTCFQTRTDATSGGLGGPGDLGVLRDVCVHSASQMESGALGQIPALPPSAIPHGGFRQDPDLSVLNETPTQTRCLQALDPAMALWPSVHLSPFPGHTHRHVPTHPPRRGRTAARRPSSLSVSAPQPLLLPVGVRFRAPTNRSKGAWLQPRPGLPRSPHHHESHTEQCHPGVTRAV